MEGMTLCFPGRVMRFQSSDTHPFPRWYQLGTALFLLLAGQTATGDLDARKAATALPEVGPLATENALDTHAASEVCPLANENLSCDTQEL